MDKEVESMRYDLQESIKVIANNQEQVSGADIRYLHRCLTVHLEKFPTIFLYDEHLQNSTTRTGLGK